MFTGIVEEVGRVSSIKNSTNSAIFTIEAEKVLEESKIGDSISVNGVCLTVTDISSKSFSADIMHESLKRSSLGELKKGSRVNLERALKLSTRLGGHIVSGHIDGVGKIKSIKKDDNAVWYCIEANEKILKYIIEKGSVAIDGISLTVAEENDKDFSVSVIPHTRAASNLSEKKIGSRVNIENDCIAKYVEKLLYLDGDISKEKSKESNIDMKFLIENGF
ncbi:riboflavin synthase alpha chain [Peptostreptococcus russellii]|uniref:Riboflavin synthase n=1 Tax=Peptostreptococcus russellii TaxID=215200 RepID=A0A1H8GUM7_9FIRM|nr:riboflavin synthase [Peptostreptococcus russellii]SEN46968.1 riboflavin synthase alpha chain [Peptostreptococcus russellii]